MVYTPVRSKYFQRTPAISPNGIENVWIGGHVRHSWEKISGKVPPPLIWAHGAGQSTEWSVSSILPHTWALIRELSQYFTVYVGDFDGTQTEGIWGNDNHIARIEEARLYLASEFLSAGPVTLIGVSMGGLGILNYAKAHPTLVRAVVPQTAVLDLTLWIAETGGAASGVHAAYGGAYSEAVHGADHNPHTWWSTLTTDIAAKIFYSSEDVTGTTGQAFKDPSVSDMVADRPSTLFGNYAGGHAEGSMPNMAADILKFCRYLT